MANRGGHPGRTLIIFGLIVAALYGLMAISNNWTPKLGLDLQGGTTITLTAQNTDGTGKIDPNSLELARTIIQSRVDSLGVGETEVTTSGDRQIIVSVPNVQQDELVRLVGQTAVLRFRAVYAVEAVTPPPTASPTPEPSGSGSPAPTTEPSAGAPSAECTQCQPERRPPTGPTAADRAAAADHAQAHRARAGHAAGQGHRLAADGGRPGGLRRVHLRPEGRLSRRLRPAAGRLQPGRRPRSTCSVRR